MRTSQLPLHVRITIDPVSSAPGPVIVAIKRLQLYHRRATIVEVMELSIARLNAALLLVFLLLQCTHCAQRLLAGEL